jgi:hypothetical protein
MAKKKLHPLYAARRELDLPKAIAIARRRIRGLQKLTSEKKVDDAVSKLSRDIGLYTDPNGDGSCIAWSLD